MYLSLVECFGGVLWSFMYRVKPSANKHALTSSFSICILFVYFTCLAKTSSAILNDESGNLCLVSDFSVNAFSFSQFTMLLSVSTCILPLLSWSVSSYPYFFPGHLSLKDAEFCQRSFPYLMRWSFGFCPILVKDGEERLEKPKVVDNFKEIVFSGHSKIFAQANSPLLWHYAQYLWKLKPDKITPWGS